MIKIKCFLFELPVHCQRILLIKRLIGFAFCALSSVKEKLTADPDSEIATTSLRVSLLCPVCNGPSIKFLFLSMDSVKPCDIPLDTIALIILSE